MTNNNKNKKNFLNQFKYDFPNQNSIRSENDLRELYTKLLKYYNDLYVNRENTMECLKQETINNEEKEVFIEMLKEKLNRKHDPKGTS